MNLISFIFSCSSFNSKSGSHLGLNIHKKCDCTMIVALIMISFFDTRGDVIYPELFRLSICGSKDGI